MRASDVWHIVGKFLMKATILLPFSPQSKVFTQSYGPSKSRESQFWEFVGIPKQKWHLGASPIAKQRVYYKGEGGGFPQVEAVISLMSLCLPLARPYTKSALTMH
jgi:hypothetical protein